MRSKKIIKLLFILGIGFYTLPLFWAGEVDFCETEKDPFKLYECRVKNICDKYKTSYPLYENATYKKAEEYKKEWNVDAWKVTLYAFEQVKEIYNKTITNQYKCAILNTQIRQLKVIDTFIDKDKTAYLKNEIGQKIKDRISKNEISLQTLKCNNTGNLKEINQVKTNVLSQTTYETCKYVIYLEYLKKYYDSTENILNIDKTTEKDEKFPIMYIAQTIASTHSRLTEEKERIMEVQPMVYSAYAEYENNYLTHLYLELIKTDFSIIRSRWNAAIAPINQVVYKISNAMKK